MIDGPAFAARKCVHVAIPNIVCNLSHTDTSEIAQLAVERDRYGPYWLMPISRQVSRGRLSGLKAQGITNNQNASFFSWSLSWFGDRKVAKF